MRSSTAGTAIRPFCSRSSRSAERQKACGDLRPASCPDRLCGELRGCTEREGSTMQRLGQRPQALPCTRRLSREKANIASPKANIGDLKPNIRHACRRSTDRCCDTAPVGWGPATGTAWNIQPDTWRAVQRRTGWVLDAENARTQQILVEPIPVGISGRCCPEDGETPGDSGTRSGLPPAASADFCRFWRFLLTNPAHCIILTLLEKAPRRPVLSHDLGGA